jgi:type IV pilus assembly protein PilE
MPAIQGLSERQTRMEQCYQDHQGAYAPADDSWACPACADDDKDETFKFSCEATKDTFTLTATGKRTMAGFTYTVNQVNTKTSSISGVASKWDATSDKCWITNKGGQPCQ